MGSDGSGMAEGILSPGFWTTVGAVARALPIIATSVPLILLSPLALSGDSGPTQKKQVSPSTTKTEFKTESENFLGIPLFNSTENATENTNPFKGPVAEPVNVVDANGNVIPVKAGEQLNESPNGDFVQVKDKDGKPTGVRKDGKHGASHSPEGQKPHAHRPDIPDLPHWLDIIFNPKK